MSPTRPIFCRACGRSLSIWDVHPDSRDDVQFYVEEESCFYCSNWRSRDEFRDACSDLGSALAQSFRIYQLLDWLSARLKQVRNFFVESRWLR